MSIILCIETGTEVCSVSLSKDNQVIAIRESSEPQAHAHSLAVFIDELLASNNLTAADLSVVAVSEGPGSYTGLRIGVSTAKGICFGSKLPMIAIGSLAALVQGALGQVTDQGALYCPMIDARRMEVYTALYNAKGEKQTDVEALIIDEKSFASELERNVIYFFGNGAGKCADVITHPNARFIDVKASAANMVPIALNMLSAEVFVDVAYYEPFYLKDFVVTKSKKNLLGL